MLYLDIVRSPYAHARIKSINSERALEVEGVLAVITGETLEAYNLHWMPTLMSDTQMVLPVDKVMFAGQEVAAVVATSRYAAADGVEAVEIEYEPLPVVVDPFKALEPDAPVLRDDKEGKTDNRIFHWEVGDRDATDRAFEEADVTVQQDMYLPRIHVASIETCGCVAEFDSVSGQLTVWMTTQAPHAIRTVFALVAGHVGLSEEKIRIISPDLGGGFGGKVPVYPGYVIAVAAAIVTGHPVKWIEDRIENLQSDSFGRDYHMAAEIAADSDGTMKALRIKTLADHGYTDAAANPSKFPAGLFSICTGSYDFQNAFAEVDGVYTNKPPGGIAYRCSFRVTEAVHAIERLVDLLATDLQMDPADLRKKNFIPADAFPYQSVLDWEYDSGDYEGALNLAMEMIGYDELRQEQAEKRARGELMGIGISSFTEIVGAGPSKHFDILGLKMFDSCELRVHPTGKATARFGTKSQGQGHETTYAQIIAQELGIPAGDIAVEEGDTDTAPYGLGTYASRSTPTAGAAGAMAAGKVRDKARKIAAHLLEAEEVAEDDLEWEPGRWFVKSDPEKGVTIQEIAFAAYTNHPQGLEAGLEAVSYYDPPNLTFPFGSYICVVDIDKRHRRGARPPLRRRRRLRQHHQPDDRRGSDPRRAGNGPRARALRGALVRREREPAQRVLRGLSGADGGRDPALGDGEDHDALAAPPARREGRRRVGHGGCATGDRQRGGGRAVAPGRTPHRHPDHAEQGVGAPPRARGHGLARRGRRARRAGAAPRGDGPCQHPMTRSAWPSSCVRGASRSPSPPSSPAAVRPRRIPARRR